VEADIDLRRFVPATPIASSRRSRAIVNSRGFMS
jgi:hypothetical protein